MDTKKTTLYQAPELDVIEIRPQKLICQSLDLGIPSGTDYEYEDW